MENTISAQHNKALEVHSKIQVFAQLAQSNLWEMCSGLKEMRDGKLYKELGYQNFEEYCETEHGFSRQNAHRYISIAEKINPENVTPGLHFGMKKLYLLSTLSEADQEKIIAENDVEKQTVKELEEKIKELRQTNSELNTELDEYDDKMAQLRAKSADDLKEANRELSRLREENQELRSRPIEVAVQEPSEDVRQLQMTIKKLEQTTDQQLDNLQNEHIRDIRELNDKHRAELDAQRQEYEDKIKAIQTTAQSSDVSERQAFKAYYTAAYDAFDRMVTFAASSNDNREFFRGKIEALISAFTNWNKDM